MEREFIEGNKLIATFMDYEYTPSPIPIPKRSFEENKFGWTRKVEWFPWYHKSMDESDCPTKRYHLARTNDDLKFHRSWDWLMPVVERIEEIYYINDVIIRGKECIIRVNIFLNKKADSKILATWKTVVDLIQWHNRQSQTKI